MPRDGTATRRRILDAAETLVKDSGYSGTSVDKVIAESGTSKGAFFHHFESKADLARALVERYAAADVGQLEEALTETAGVLDPGDRLIAFVRHFEDRGDEIISGTSNCLYNSILAEQGLDLAEARQPIRWAVGAWREAIADLLHPALPADSPVDVDALADHVFVTFEGAFILCRSTAEPAHMRSQLRVLRELLAAVVGEPGRPTATGTSGSST